MSYLKFKEFEKQYNTTFNYWLEPSLKQNIRRALITILQEYYEGFDESNYKVSETDYDLLINHLYKQIKNKKINTYKEIDSLINI